MKNTNNQKIFEKRKNELKKYLINNPMPTESKNSYFEDGASMIYFLRTYKEKLLEDKEIKKIIESKNNQKEQQHVKKIENVINNAYELIPLINTLEFNSKSDFCRQANISESSFKYLITVLKKHEPELYQEIENLIKARINRVIEPTDDILNLLEALKESQKNNTKFNIIDYTNTIDISVEHLKKIVNNLNLSNEDKKIILSFISQYTQSNFKPHHRVSSILSQEITMPDKNGNPVTATNQEKEYIINFMDEYNIPILPSTFIMILKEYINDKEVFEKIKNNKTKTKKVK